MKTTIVRRIGKDKKRESDTPSYVAHGTYGCVLKPAVTCKTGVSPKNKISKLFYDKEELISEYGIQMQVIHLLDPKGKFTVRAFGACKVQYDEFVASELVKCKKSSGDSMFEPGKSIKQIVYDDGGIDLNVLIKNKQVSFDQVFWAMGNIFDGLIVLATKGYVHLDIKTPNMVYSENGNGKVVLIDFGLCTTQKEVLNKNYDTIHKYKYSVYPPEFTTMWDDAEDIDRLQNFKQLMRECSLPINPSNAWYNMAVATMSGSEDGYFKPIADKIDVYSFGACLLCLFCKLDSKLFDAGSKFEMPLKDLISGMIHMDPKMRFSPLQARRMYNKIVSSVPIMQSPCPNFKKRSVVTKRCGSSV